MPAARKIQNFDVDDGAVEFVDVRDAACAVRWRLRVRIGRVDACAGDRVFARCRSEFVAGENFDGVLHARVVGEDVVAALAVAEEADDAGMGAVENADDAAFGALGAGTVAGAQDFGEDVVAVHGVLDGRRGG